MHERRTPVRTLETMNDNASSDIQGIVTDLLNGRPYSHRQDVDSSVAAVITVQEDLRFFDSTFEAVLRQRILPGTIVVADCARRVSQPMQLTFDVIPSPAGVITTMPENKTVRVILVGADHAVSFADAVRSAIAQFDIGAEVRALWMLHDDSRPADDSCLEAMLDAWKNTPMASLLGAKQLDWPGRGLHDVGMYADGHKVVSLVVDGEPDQEQYDGRSDVFAVSLAGALVPLATLKAWDGIDPWFGTFGESRDFCRRICLGGGRVVVVPQARIAHARARFEGLRLRNGHAVDDDAEPADSYLAVREAQLKYAYTDVHRTWWPLLWLWSIVLALGLGVRCLAAKQPYRACCELTLPWRALPGLRGAWRARARIRRQGKVSAKALPTLQAGAARTRQWRERQRAFLDQRDTVILGPLAKAHLRRRLARRWGMAAAAAAIAFVWVAVLYWDVLRSVFAGGSMYSAALLPTNATLAQLAQSATTSWSFADGVGISAPGAPWLLVLLVASVLTGGHVAAAVGCMFFLAAPLSVLSFWALAGVFTRSDAVRCVGALAWFAASSAMGLYDDADLPMLTVMVFLPAAFAFSFRAVGMYRTEDLVSPRASVQAAATAALCFIPAVAAEPQLLLPLMVTFLVFLMFVRSHRTTLLLIPLPAAFVCAPTLVNAVRFADEGTWRQIFGSVMLPSSTRDGSPASMDVLGVAFRAFGISVSDRPWGLVGLSVLSMIAVLALASLFLPFMLRSSRMMWVASLSGFALALLAAHVCVAVDAAGVVAASVLPGVSFTMMGLLACVCMVAGGAVQRFSELRQSGDASSERPRATGDSVVVRTARAILVCLLAAMVVSCMVFDYVAGDHGQVRSSDSGLPMVASDYLEQDSARRILAVRADGAGSVSYASMRTRRGDLIDSSPAQRVEAASGRAGDTDKAISKDCARLLANADSDAIANLSRLGFGGIYVVRGQSSKGAFEQLSSNIGASEGTQEVVGTNGGNYYRLTIQDIAKQHVDQTGFHEAHASIWRYAWLWCMGLVIAAYCLVALPRFRREGQEES